MTPTSAWMSRKGTTRFVLRAQAASFAAVMLGVCVQGALIGAIPGSSAPAIWRLRT
jgi:hypothetical protein